MSGAPEAVGRVVRNGALAAAWVVSRVYRPGTYWVSVFGEWPGRRWVQGFSCYAAVVDDHGNLVAIP